MHSLPSFTIGTVKELLKYPLEVVFKKIEDNLMRCESDVVYPVIFVIGPPRSGSTLLYQLITRSFRVCYFSNFMMRFPFSPCIIAKFAALFNGCEGPNNFSSNYGEIPGWKAPNQGQKFWNRWFPNDQSYVGSGVLSQENLKEIRKTVALLQSSFRSPFINKWQGHCVRILSLAEVFPHALFIRIKRNLAMSAQSILHARRTFLLDESKWMSSKPKEYDSIKQKGPLEQVCEQVFYLEKNMDHDMALIGENRCMIVHYDELCASPRRMMDRIRFFVTTLSSSLLEKRNSIPSSFPMSKKIMVSADEFRVIESYLNRMQMK